MKPYAFDGQTAVVTGAASGLGAALAGALAERGSSLALVDRDSAGLQRVVTAIGAAQPRLTVAHLAAHPEAAGPAVGMAQVVDGL